jgi:NAD(P)-dependent dehydrogenase (short-subunit alcohol dehydrogenase family)
MVVPYAGMTDRLSGKVALVTGGAQGIGRAIAEKLAAEGARVTFLDRDREGGAATAREVGAGVAFLPADVTRETEVEAAIGAVVEGQGRLDVLVNNAGVNAYFDATEMTEAQWDAVFAVDLKGAWICAKHALPAMKQARGGSIVNIASIHAGLTIAGMFPYAAAKSGLVGLTRSLALDYAPFGIRVNAVLPGWTRTRLVEEWFRLQPDPAEAERRVLAVHPLGRLSTPMEVANLVAFVASDEASAITGAALAVDGGLSARFAT